MGLLPDFTQDGLLPAGDYSLTLEELRASLLVVGPPIHPSTWDAQWRMQLIDNFEILVTQLWKVGISNVFIDGSFAENKDHPNDIDGYFECDFMQLATGFLELQLNLLDAFKVWTWAPESRRPFPGSTKDQLPMWHQYRVELFPHFGNGPRFGAKDKNGKELLFPSAFRNCRRTGKPKGIIQIVQNHSMVQNPRRRP